MIEFDREIELAHFNEFFSANDVIPSRELIIRASLFRSIMELGQKHINFGLIDKNEVRNKTIVIRNNSEFPLLYSIKKSGLISSGDIVIRVGRIGIIRAYGKREVEFTFDPTLHGIFQEKLIIENIWDNENDQAIIVKANVRKPLNFFLRDLSIDFGVCLIDEFSPNVQEIVISNTSESHSRTFQITVDTHDLQKIGFIPEIIFELLDNVDEEYYENVESRPEGAVAENEVFFGLQKKVRKRQQILLSKDVEEEIEQLEQKLKIAQRKGKEDKAEKLADKLVRLRSGVVKNEYDAISPFNDKGVLHDRVDSPGLMNDVNSQVDLFAESFETRSEARTESLYSKTALKQKRTESTITIVLDPRQIKTVAVSFRAIESKKEQNVYLESSDIASKLKIALDNLCNKPNEKSELYEGSIIVHESKNTDIVKIVFLNNLG